LEKKIDILLIEDNPADAGLLKIYLKECYPVSHNLKVVDYLKKGIELVGKESYSIIILDLSLPDSTGLDTFNRLHAVAPETPIIVLTGLEDEEVAINAVKCGAQDFLVKGTLKSKTLQRSIDYGIERSRLLKQLSENAKKLEAKTTDLLREKIKLSEAQKLAHIGSWEWDIKTNLVTWSEELQRIYGLAATEVSATYEKFVEYVHPEDREFVKKTIAEALKTQLPFSFYYQVLTPQNKICIIHARGEIIIDENKKAVKVYGTGQDVTERIREEEMENLALAATKSYNSVIIANNEGEIEWVNEGFTKLTGYTLKDMLSTHGEILRQGLPTGLSRITENYETVVKGKKPVTYEAKNFTKDGKEYWVITTLTPVLGKDGNVKRIIAIDSDITERKLMEYDLLRANRIAEHSLMKGNKALDELMKAKKNLEHTMKIKEQFMANMSHEIRTPMNAIVGMTDILMDSDLNSEQKECTTAIKTSADNLLSIINDILDFSKIESGKILFEKVPFNIKSVLESVMKMLHFSSEKKGLNLTLQVSENIPQVIIGDVVRLRQILLNLISNSIKFTERGSVLINIQLKEEHDDNIVLLFTVKDTGIGIPEDKLSVVFESFTQASNDTTRKYGGTGLGLTIVKQLVELQSGAISVESKVNDGTTFLVTLPYAKGKPVDASVKANDNDVAYNELENIKILVVEDNSLNQMVAKKVLSKWQVKIDVADNGKMAIDKVIQSNYDAVLMDIQMPEMDGYDATKYIREKLEGAKSKVPIIAMTACAMVGEAEKCIEAGMNDYISKPFNQKDLYEKIVRLVKKNHYGTAKVENNKSIAMEDKNNIDLTYLKEIANGSNEFMREMIETFTVQTPPMLEMMKSHLNEKRWSDLGGLAHKMKPTVDFIGMHSIKETVKDIEEYCKAKTNLDKLPDMLDKINKVCAEAIEELKLEVSNYQ